MFGVVARSPCLIKAVPPGASFVTARMDVALACLPTSLLVLMSEDDADDLADVIETASATLRTLVVGVVGRRKKGAPDMSRASMNPVDVWRVTCDAASCGALLRVIVPAIIHSDAYVNIFEEARSCGAILHFISGVDGGRQATMMDAALAAIQATQPHRRHAYVRSLIEDGRVTRAQATALLGAVEWLHSNRGASLTDVMRDRQGTESPMVDSAVVMVYPQYGHGVQTYPDLVRTGLVPSATFNDLLEGHMDMPEFRSAKDKCMGTVSDAVATIRAVASRCRSFIHVAMCGHGTLGALIMADRKPLTQAAVAAALADSGFRGRALVSLNSCQSSTDPVVDTSEDPWGTGATFPFDWTVVTSCDDSQVRCNADHFARAMSAFHGIVRDGTEDQVDFQEVVRVLWRQTRSPDEPQCHWMPRPDVRVGAAAPALASCGADARSVRRQLSDAFAFSAGETRGGARPALEARILDTLGRAS